MITSQEPFWTAAVVASWSQKKKQLQVTTVEKPKQPVANLHGNTFKCKQTSPVLIRFVTGSSSALVPSSTPVILL